jgi:hypothetical protein
MSTTTTIFTAIGESPHSPQLEFFLKKCTDFLTIKYLFVKFSICCVYKKKKDASLQQLVQAWVIFIN